MPAGQELRGRIDGLEQLTACPTCQRPMDARHKQRLRDEYTQQGLALRDEFRVHEASYRDLDTAVKKAEVVDIVPKTGRSGDIFVLTMRHSYEQAGRTLVVDEFDAPLAAEFAYCYEQQNLGLSPEASLRDLARRTGLLEIKIFVLALLVQPLKHAKHLIG